MSATREGLTWTHAFNATMDYQRDNGVETKGRYFASSYCLVRIFCPTLLLEKATRRLSDRLSSS